MSLLAHKIEFKFLDNNKQNFKKINNIANIYEAIMC